MPKIVNKIKEEGIQIQQDKFLKWFFDVNNDPEIFEKFTDIMIKTFNETKNGSVTLFIADLYKQLEKVPSSLIENKEVIPDFMKSDWNDKEPDVFNIVPQENDIVTFILKKKVTLGEDDKSFIYMEIQI